MKHPEDMMARILYPLIFAIWAGFLICLLITRRYTEFIRPEFGLLLAVAHLIAMAFMLAAVVRNRDAATDLSSVFRGLVLLVPVLYFIAMPRAMLGNQAFKKRFTGAGRESSYIRQSESAGASFADDVKMQKPSESPTILDILINPARYRGKTVRFTAMILHDPQLKPHFGGRDTVVYRFLITCCAADALPLSIALDTDKARSFDDDQWVDVEGIFDVQADNGTSVPVVTESRIKAANPPGSPYLF